MERKGSAFAFPFLFYSMKIVKVIIFQVVLFLLACSLIEIYMRYDGALPGDLRPNWLYFKPVDSLYVIPDFITNPEGMVVAGKDYWEQQHVYINEEGFRTKEISQISCSKRKLLFIGDSFTWGMSAEPFNDSSFCDLLAKDTALEVINAGIPVADPVQYAAVAVKYIPLIKPDMVFVMFYVGNDLMRTDRTIVAGRPFYYWTNAGAIYAGIDGRHFNSAQQAYDYLANEKYFLRRPQGWCESVVAKSALLSKLYSVKFRIEEKVEAESARKNSAVTKKYLQQIVSIAEQNKSDMRIIIIPESKEANLSRQEYFERYSDLLKDATLNKYFLMPQCSESWYKGLPDTHLNNEGHRKYTEYIRSIIASSNH